MSTAELDLTDIDAYHADTSHVTASMLKSLHRSPRIFEAEYVTRTLLREPSPAMAFGTALHTAVLEPERFETEYVVCPPNCSDRRTKAHKEWAVENEGRSILTLTDYERLRACVAAVRSHPIAGKAIEARGDVEKPVVWTDEATGVRCKCRPDKRISRVVLDLKTTEVCSEEAFVKTVVDFGYHIQSGHYLRGIDDADLFMFVVVEKSQPYRCRTFQLKSDALDCGDYLVGQLLTDYARRTETGDWSEPNESDLVAIDLPEWYTKRVYRS